MTLDQATRLIQETSNAMSILYGATVFDELAVVSREGRCMRLTWYHGPRREDFVRSFSRDTAALREETRARLNTTQEYQVGDFHFVKEGVGTQAESFVRLGESVYLICGNTELSMADIAKKPKWLAAQKPFVEMCDRFRISPLALDGAADGPELGRF